MLLEPRCVLHPLLTTPQPQSCPDVVIEVFLDRKDFSFQYLNWAAAVATAPGMKSKCFMLLLSRAWCLTLALLEEAMAVGLAVRKAGELNTYCD